MLSGLSAISPAEPKPSPVPRGLPLSSPCLLLQHQSPPPLALSLRAAEAPPTLGAPPLNRLLVRPVGPRRLPTKGPLGAGSGGGVGVGATCDKLGVPDAGLNECLLQV